MEKLSFGVASPPSKLLLPIVPNCLSSSSYSCTLSFHKYHSSSTKKLLYGALKNGGKKQIQKSTSSFVVKCGGGGGLVSEINDSQFSDLVLKSECPVLVEFVATWCGPCRLIAPAVQSLAQEYEDKLTVVKIDHDSNPSLIEKYKVYGLPTLLLFKDGKEVPESRREGAITKAKLKEYVDTLLQSVSVF